MQELEDLYITSDGSAIYRDSPAMAWILEGKAQAEEELRKQFEAFKQQFVREAEAKLEKRYAKELEEAKKKEEEAKKKMEAEAEAKKKIAEQAKMKIEAEAKKKDAAILKLIDADVAKETVASVWGMTLKELEVYLLKIQKKKEGEDSKSA